ncbi:MAG: hypothetical protein AAGB00_02890 [Planctomycetota bacterium]
MLRYAVVCSLAFALLGVVCGPASAFPQFKKPYAELYAPDKGSDYGALVKKANCYLCHQGKKKSNKNAYGNKLDPLLGKEDKKNVEKIMDALKQVAEMPSVDGDDSSPTFGALIAEGKLPGGTIEECKEEPAE